MNCSHEKTRDYDLTAFGLTLHKRTCKQCGADWVVSREEAPKA